MGYMFPSLDQLGGFLDREKSFISVAALLSRGWGEVRGMCPAQEEAPLSLILQRVNLRPLTFYLTVWYRVLGYHEGGTEGSESLSMDRVRWKCIVR